ncbi:LD-carboxypeptidase [Sphingosinicella terrae]|uniref:LD-carboxypeptidase n=1 Tax=Sphingosinicella terrae TaxID=2172047 RepID=UPI000E0CD684|nr:LD-carboxypeptidase [Sphingosinicella terrae]
MRIGIVAPSSRFDRTTADRVQAVAAACHPRLELVFHPQCFLSWRHFAGTDEERGQALVDYANDPGLDAIWFARGGYGACRIAEDAIGRLGPNARDKAYLGYSDSGYLLAGLQRAGCAEIAHGPMPQDVTRDGGEAAVRRALAWLVERSPSALEPGLDPERPNAAFNLTVLSQLLGTSLEPDLSGHVLIVEEVSEQLYRIDRSLFHLTGNRLSAGLAGLRLGRCRDVPPNDPDFGADEEEIARFWCARAGINWLGRADIGHDADNKVVPFGRR